MKLQQISLILAWLMIAGSVRAGVKPAIDLQAHQFPPQDVRLLIPFYDVQHQRYTVYWQVLSQTEWKQQQSDIHAKWNRESARLAAWEEKASADAKASK